MSDNKEEIKSKQEPVVAVEVDETPAKNAVLDSIADADAIQERLENSADFVKKNLNLVAYVVGGIALAVAGFFGYKYYIAEQNAEAEKKMFQAQFYFEADSTLNKALNGDGLNPGFIKISDEYSGTKAANLANFYAGVIYLKQGNFDKAIEKLSAFSSSDLIVQARAYSLLGDAYLEKNNVEEAINFYKKAVDYKENKGFTPSYSIKLATAYEIKKDNAAAIEIYNSIIEKYPTAPEATEAKKLKAFLEGNK